MERGGNKEGRVERGIGEGERRSEREREKEQSTDLRKEFEAFGIGFGFEQNQEIKRVGQSKKEKKALQPIVAV